MGHRECCFNPALAVKNRVLATLAHIDHRKTRTLQSRQTNSYTTCSARLIDRNFYYLRRVYGQMS